MLKLLKHNFKESYLEVLILGAVFIAVSLLCIISASASSSSLFSIAIFAWAICLIAVLVVVLKTIINSLSSRLFTDQGYLTLTTPVSIDKLLISKIIVSMVWVLFLYIIMFASMFLIFSANGDTQFIFSEIFKSIFGSGIGDALLVSLDIIMSILSFVVMLLFVLVFSNIGRIRRHKLLVGILMYLGINFIISLINNSLADILPLGTIIPNIVWTVLFYFTSRYLIVNKLELE